MLRLICQLQSRTSLPPIASSLQPPAHAGSSSVTDFSTLKIEAIRSSETSVHRRENLKSYKSNVCLLACLPDYFMMLFHFPGLVISQLCTVNIILGGEGMILNDIFETT
jgi:hypothetical protein